MPRSHRRRTLDRVAVPFLVVLAIGLAGCDRIVEAIAMLVLLMLVAFADILAMIGLGITFFSGRAPHLVHLVLAYMLLGVYGFGAVMLDQTTSISRNEMLHLLAVGLPLSLPVLLWPVWATAIHIHRQSTYERPAAPLVAGAVVSVAILGGLALFARAYGATPLPLRAITVIPHVAEYRKLIDATRAELTKPAETTAAEETTPRLEQGPLPARAPYSLLASVGETLAPQKAPELPGDAPRLRLVEARAYGAKRLRVVTWELADRAAAADAREPMMRWAEGAKVYFPKMAQNERVLLVVGFVDDKPVTAAQEEMRMRFVRAFSAGTP